MNCNFDSVVTRKATESIKWDKYDTDVLPLWIADMDFQCPQLLLDSVTKRTKHGIFGYSKQSNQLRPVIVERLSQNNNWEIDPDSLIFYPSVLNSISMLLAVISQPGDEVIVFTPSYPPLVKIPENFDLVVKSIDMVLNQSKGYEIDFDAFESAISKRTRIMLLCNPHNPTGRCFSKNELIKIADICLKHDVLIVSDDIHSDLVFSNSTYTPIASLSKEVASQTITLFGPGKSFNIPGLKISMAIASDPEVRTKLKSINEKFHIDCNVLSYHALETAYRDCQPWLTNLLSYLEKNRDFLSSYIADNLSTIKLFRPESTFMAWLDCREIDIEEKASKFFFEKAKVALNDGADFGVCGEGFVRINFGCPRSILEEALGRMQKAIKNTIGC